MSESLMKLARRNRAAEATSSRTEAPGPVDTGEVIQIPESRPAAVVARQLGYNLLREFDPLSNDNQPAPDEIKTGGWQRPEGSDQPGYRLRRRLGAALLAMTTVAGGFLVGEKTEGWPPEMTYSVDQRQPAEGEICTTRGVGQRALLVVASEFTDNLSARRAAASRIRQAIDGQTDQRFGICYDPETELTRVLPTKAVAGLPDGRRVNWSHFPGRTDQPDQN